MELAECTNRGWSINGLKDVSNNMASPEYSPSVSTFVDLPPYLKAKQAIINVKNSDERCLMWALLSALHPGSRNPQRISIYRQYENELDFTGIEFPVSLQDIPKVERLNDLSINVFAYEAPVTIKPMYLSKREGCTIDLLLYRGHYCWIKRFSRIPYWGLGYNTQMR